ncbi:MAG: flagellin [Lachnospiraceae bacterium]|nr:flagellin [Lachnospiraceae bacterium]
MRIGTNMSAIVACGQLSVTERNIATSLGRLSSGYKINSAKDDSAGMAISEKLRAQIKGLDRASMNASDGISVSQSAEGALNEVHSMLQRMRELAVQGATDSYCDDDRESIQEEIEALQEEINRISTDTDFNGTKLLNGEMQRRTYTLDDEGKLNSDLRLSYITNDVPVGEYSLTMNADGTVALGAGFTGSAIISYDNNKVNITDHNGFKMMLAYDEENIPSGDFTLEVWDIGTMAIQLGANSGQEMAICIPEISSESLNVDKLDLTTSEGCRSAITKIDEAISRVSLTRAQVGADQNRLECAISSLDVTSENMSSALSSIQDTDMAEEMSTYTQLNVMQQAGMSMLAQANQLPEKVLQLLQ